MKLSIGKQEVRATQEDIVQSAMEALECAEKMREARLGISEIDVVCENLEISIDCIKKNGLKAYIYGVDPQNSFAKTFGLESYEGGLSDEALEALQEKYIDAGCEGLKELIGKFVDYVKRFLKGIVGWIKFYILNSRAKWSTDDLNDLKKIVDETTYVSTLTSKIAPNSDVGATAMYAWKKDGFKNAVDLVIKVFPALDQYVKDYAEIVTFLPSIQHNTQAALDQMDAKVSAAKKKLTDALKAAGCHEVYKSTDPHTGKTIQVIAEWFDIKHVSMDKKWLLDTWSSKNIFGLGFKTKTDMQATVDELFKLKAVHDKYQNILNELSTQSSKVENGVAQLDAMHDAIRVTLDDNSIKARQLLREVKYRISDAMSVDRDVVRFFGGVDFAYKSMISQIRAFVSRMASTSSDK